MNILLIKNAHAKKNVHCQKAEKNLIQNDGNANLKFEILFHLNV